MATEDGTTRRTGRSRTGRRDDEGVRARRRTGRVLGGRGPAWDTEVSPPARNAPASQDARSTVRWSPQHDQIQLIASLIEAGVTIDVAFDTLATMGGSSGTREAATSVRDALRAGRTLSDALDGVAVPLHVCALVRGGERIGRIAPAMRAAADLVRCIAGLREELRRALLYPAVVLTLGLGILVVVALVVVPPLERTFNDLGGELPTATRAVLAVSRPLRSPALLLLVPVVVGLRSVLRRGRRKSWRPSAGIMLPVMRRLDHDVRLSLLARLMATMLGGGLPLIDALRTVEDTLPPGRVQARVRAAGLAVEAGGSVLSDDALGGLLDPAERELLAVAERTGLLAAQWERVAERRDAALAARIRRLGTIAEPLLVVLVGALVGGAVLALYLPTFRVLDLL